MLTIYCLEYIYCKCTIILFACMWTIMLMYIHYKSTYYRLIIQPPTGDKYVDIFF